MEPQTIDHESIQATIQKVVEPLTEELTRIDREIARHELALEELKNDRRTIDAIVRRANGTYAKPGPRKPKTNPHASKTGRWDDVIVAYLERDGVPTDHLVASHVYRAMKRDAIAKGKGQRGYPGHASVKTTFERLHAAGYLRRVGTGKGGHAIYATVNRNGNRADDDG